MYSHTVKGGWSQSKKPVGACRVVEGMGGAKGRVSMAASKQRRKIVSARSRVNDGDNPVSLMASEVVMQHKLPMVAIWAI